MKWDVQVGFTAAKIRAFFSKNKWEIEQAVATLMIDYKDIEEFQNAIVAGKFEDETISMQDLENEKKNLNFAATCPTPNKKTWNGLMLSPAFHPI